MFLSLSSFFPRKLPVGMTSFNRWVEDAVILSGLPNNASTRRLAGLFILNLPPTVGYQSLRRISNQLIKAAANQVASEVIKEGMSNGPEAVQEAPAAVGSEAS